MKRTLLLLMSMLLLLPGCNKVVNLMNPDAEPELQEEEPSRPQYIVLTKSEESVRDAANRFGRDVFVNLFREADGRDVAFSPLSLSLALSMTAEGAEGDTYKEFVKVLGFGDVSKADVGSFYKTMIAGLVTADEKVSFSSNNSLWVQTGYPVKNDFKTLLSEYYAVENYSVNFGKPDTEATVKAINQWCSDKTDGKIPALFSALDPQTRMVLVNALLFKAPWAFEWEVRKDRPFTTAAGTSVQKDYLFVDKMLPYREFETYEWVSVPYGNGLYELILMLPKGGQDLSTMLASFDAADLMMRTDASVELQFPMFSTDYSTEETLIPILKEMGLKLPFDPGKANLSGMVDSSQFLPDENLYVAKLLQKVRIDVNEKGTEFAAVTGSAVGATSVPERVLLNFNRPFVYAIWERSSATVLLYGTVSQ